MIGGRRRYRERTYPYIIRAGTIATTGLQCEACKDVATHRIEYENDKQALGTLMVILCTKHERLTRFGNWSQLWKDIDRKIEGKK